MKVLIMFGVKKKNPVFFFCDIKGVVMTKSLTLQPGVSYAPAGNNVQDNPNVSPQKRGCDSVLTAQNQSDEHLEVKQTL